MAFSSSGEHGVPTPSSLDDSSSLAISDAEIIKGYSISAASSPVTASKGVGGYDGEMLKGTPMDAPACVPAVPDSDLSDDINFAVRDWNAEYQRLLESRFETAELELERTQKLRNLADEFARVATAIGTTIITERFMRPEERSVEVIEKLGVAGGEKYVHGPQRIFFKLCVDSHGLYGGDEGAAKAAGNELKGIMEYMDCRLAGLRFPLTVLIDYLGYRLMAESILPIDRTTLVYGSADGGRTIESSDEHVNRLMQRAAGKLNLTSHLVWDASRGCHALSSCVDIEVHRGKDQRLYLIDAARAMPPSTPVSQLKGCNLYRLLRPEFVARHATPLCPDAYGGWPLENGEKLARDIDEATTQLLTVACPRFAALLDEAPAAPDELTVMAHQAGVNVRFLGVVCRSVKKPLSRMLLLSEIVSRTIKNVLRHRMRLIRSDRAEAYHAVAIEGLNSFLVGQDPAYWGRDFKRSVLKRFPESVSREDMENPNFDLRCCCSPALVLKRVSTLLSLLFTTRAQLRALRLFYPAIKDAADIEQVLLSPAEQAWAHWKSLGAADRSGARLLPEEIVSMTPRVKTLHVLPFEEGTALARQAKDFQQADSRYRATVMIKPSDLRALHNWGISCTLHAVALLNNNRPTTTTAQGASGDVETTAVTLFRRAVAKYRTCISINSQDWVALYLWGNTLLSWFEALMLRQRDRTKADAPLLPELLHRARERYETAWLACVGTSPDVGQVSAQQVAAASPTGGRVRELLYAWGNTYLLEALHCEPVDREKLLRAAVAKYQLALSLCEEVRQAKILAHSLEYRLLYNLSVALARLMTRGEMHYSQAVAALQRLCHQLQDPPPYAVLFHWASLTTRHIRQLWGALGVGRDKRQGLEALVLEGLHRWAEACDACLAQNEAQVGPLLDGWGQLLFLWSEIRFKLYGTHHSLERAATSTPVTPQVKRRQKRGGSMAAAAFVAAATGAASPGGKLGSPRTSSQTSQTSDWSASADDISEDTEKNADPLTSESEEDAPESSESGEDEGDMVSEDIFVYSVDLYLYTFVSIYKGRPGRALLDSLIPLGASKDYILSTHTIGAVLSLASDRQEVTVMQDCERVLSAIRRTGGNHKLKLDAEVGMFLPQVVRQCVAEAVRGPSAQAAIGGQFGHERPHLRADNSTNTMVEQLDYDDLWHGATLEGGN